MIPVIRIIALILGVTCVLVSSADLREDLPMDSGESLQPRAVFDLPMWFRAGENTSSEQSGRGSFSPYRPCKNGSGGLCVKQGQCPAGFEAPPGGCRDGSECCYSPGQNDKSCSGRGGTCRSRSSCDGAVLNQRTNCESRGQVCCVYLK